MHSIGGQPRTIFFVGDGSQREDLERICTDMCFLLWSFLSDGIFTLSNRFRKGENVFMPHRRHLYQRLVQTGLKCVFFIQSIPDSYQLD